MGDLSDSSQGTRWGNLSERLSLIVMLIAMLAGFVTQFAVTRHQTDTLSKSLEGLTAAVQDMSTRLAKVEEWKSNQGEIPTVREFEALRNQVGEIRIQVDEIRSSYITGVEVDSEISQVKYSIIADHLTPLSNRVNRLEDDD